MGKKINMKTAKVAKEKLSRKRSREKQWMSEETHALMDERRHVKAHVKNVNDPEYKEKSRAIRRACRKDTERYTEDKCATIVGLCKRGRTRERHNEIRTLVNKFTPTLNAIKDAPTKDGDILARWKEYCEGMFTKYGSTGASTTECDDVALLHKLIVRIWQTCEWPEDWRRAVRYPYTKER